MALTNKSKLKMTPKKPGLPPIHVSPPAVQVESPVNVEAPDMSGIASALSELSAIMVQLVKQQEAILKTLEEHHQTMGVLANREAKISMPEIKVPQVKMPARPKSFSVQIARPGEEPTTMRIQADKMN